MNRTVLRWFGQTMSVGILTTENGSSSFLELAAREVPFPSSPLASKSHTLEPVLMRTVVSLVSSYSPQEIEVWLTSDWGLRATLPAPSLPEDEIVEHLRWEIGCKLNDDGSRFLFRHQLRSDGKHEVAVLRPAVETFWRKMCDAVPCRLTTIRIGEPSDTIEQWLQLGFNDEVTGESIAASEPEGEVNASPKQKSKKLWWILIAAVVLLSAGIVGWKLYSDSQPSHSYRPAKKQPPPATMKSDSNRNKTILPDSGSLQPSSSDISTKPVNSQVVTTFTAAIRSIETIGQLETAALTPGEILIQLIVDGDKKSLVKTKFDSVGIREYRTIYDGITLRFNILLTIPTYSTNQFNAVTSDSVHKVGEGWEGKMPALLTWVEKQTALPYRITIVKAGEVWRAVVVL